VDALIAVVRHSQVVTISAMVPVSLYYLCVCIHKYQDSYCIRMIYCIAKHFG
jgi:hypothetical protein